MFKPLTIAAKTAIKRNKMSTPTRQVLRVEREVASRREPWHPWLDYGCGRGDDVRFLRAELNGYEHLAFRDDGWLIDGYDPGFGRDDRRFGCGYDVVTCTYVLNVIESEVERIPVIQDVVQHLSRGGVAYFSVRTDVKKDGVTRAQTYQTNYTPERLQATLQVALDLRDDSDKRRYNVALLQSDRPSSYAIAVVHRTA